MQTFALYQLLLLCRKAALWHEFAEGCLRGLLLMPLR